MFGEIGGSQEEQVAELVLEGYSIFDEGAEGLKKALRRFFDHQMRVERWLAAAAELTAEQIERLGDPRGGFFVAAEFALEGETGACTLAREWADRAELADQREAHDGPEAFLRSEARERGVELETEHHPDREAREADQRHRQHAGVVEGEMYRRTASRAPFRRTVRTIEAGRKPITSSMSTIAGSSTRRLRALRSTVTCPAASTLRSRSTSVP